MKLLLTGATGFVGSALVGKIARSDGSAPPAREIRVLARDPENARKTLAPRLIRTGCELSTFAWDAENEVAPATALDGVDAVIHLAGENVGGGRWTPERKRRILESRRLGTRNLVAGINALTQPPILISVSAVGYYGNRGNEQLIEESDPGRGFLAEVCQAWESEARAARVARLVQPRLGLVLGPNGGALEKMLPLFKAGLGGRLGDGQQWMSWIHLDDLVEFFRFALRHPLHGTYNAAAPEPVRNEAFTRILGETLHRPTAFRVPALGLKLALGEMAEETLLASQRVSAHKLLEAGFTFQYAELAPALAASLRP